MNPVWERICQAIAARRLRAAARAERTVRLPGRMDFVFMLAISICVAVLAATGGALALGHAVFGWFDDPPLAPVADRRLLTSFRNHVDAGPFVDMSVSDATDELFVLRRDGMVHRMDLRTDLWEEEAMREQVPAVSADMIALRAGCGGGAMPIPDCANLEAVWALSAEGGLAVREDGVWRSLIGDVPWRGFDGELVEESALSALAVSEDGRWILAGTKNQGIGLFDTTANMWVEVDADAQRLVLGAGREDEQVAVVTHLVWTNGRFWIAGPAGLARLDPTSFQKMPVRDDSVDGAVLDLDLTSDGRLIALVEGPCPADGEGCLSVLDVRGPDRSDVVIGETERHPDLSDQGVSYAAMRGDAVLVLGEAGIHRYDPARRNWVEIEAGPVTAHFEPTDGKTLFAAVPGAVVMLRGLNIVARWTLEGKRIEQLVPSDGEDVLAIDRDRTAYRLRAGSAVELRRASSSALDPRQFTHAARAGDILVLGGPGGLLFHDVATRTYRMMNANTTPAALISASSRLYSPGGDAIWAIEDGRTVSRIRIASSGSGGVAGTGQGSGLPDQPMRLVLPEAVQALQPDVNGAFAILEDAGPIRLEHSGSGLQQTALVGTERAAGMRDPISAAVYSDNSVLFADPRHLWLYDLPSRSWRDPGKTGLGGQKLIGLAIESGWIFTIGENGLMARQSQAKSDTVMGHGPVFPFGFEALEDAVADGAGRIYLAGGGAVVAYSRSERRIKEIWHPAGDGPIILAGTVAGRPVGRHGDRAFVGARDLTLPEASTTSVSLGSGEIVTVQERHGERFLAVFPGNGEVKPDQARCYFGKATPPESDLRDAVQLPDGRLAVLSGDQVALYDPETRRWRRTNWKVPARTRRLRVLGSWLVASGEGQLSGVPVERIADPGSCAFEAVMLSPQIHDAAQVSVSKTAGAALLFGHDGALSLWQGGGTKALLPAATEGPVPADLIRVFPDGPGVAALSRDSLWRYDRATRQWGRTRFVGIEDGSVVTADARDLGDGRFAVTAWTSDSRSYGGVAARSEARVILARLSAMALPDVPWRFDAMLDAVEMDARWYFLLSDRLVGMNLRSNRWDSIVTFGDAREDRRLRRLHGLIGVEQGPADDPDRLYLFPRLPTNGVAIAAEAAALVYDRTGGEDFAVVDGATSTDKALLRFASDGVAYRCSVRGGLRSPGDCDALTDPPLRFPAEGLEAAYEVGNRIAIFRNGSVQMLDRQSRRLKDVQATLSTKGGTPRQAFDIDEALWLHYADGEVWLLRSDGSARQLASDVAAVYDAGGDKGIWFSRRNGEVSLVDRSGTILAREETLEWFVPDWRGDARITLFSPQLRGVVALTANGTILNAEAGRVVKSDDLLTLLGAPPIATPLGILPFTQYLGWERREGYWVQDGSWVHFVTRDTCVAALSQRHPIVDGRGNPAAGKFEAPTLACAINPITFRLPEAHGDAVPRIRSVRQAPGDGLDFAVDGGRFEWRADGVRFVSDEVQPLKPPPRAIDRAAELRDAITNLTVGDPRLDVPRLVPVANEVRLEQDGGRVDIVYAGSMVSETVAALATSWFSWNRSERQFFVGAGDAPVSITPDALIVDGRFLPAEEGRLYQWDSNTVVHANPHGLWRYTGKPDPNGRGPLYQAMDLPIPDDIAHGRFLLGTQSLPIDGGTVDGDFDGITVRLDALQVSDSWRARRVRARIPVAGRPTDAFTSRGFAFDRRYSVGWRAGEPVILTELGLIPPGRIAEIDPPPDPTSAGDWRLDTFGGELYARRGGAEWRQTTTNGWRETGDPSRSWLMVDSGPWVWRRTAGVTRIEPKSLEVAWRTHRRPDGGFESDRLNAAAATTDQIVLVTQSGTEAVDSSAQIIAPAVALGPSPRDPFRVKIVMDARSGPAILAGGGSNEMLWDMGAGTWQARANGTSSHDTRVAVETDGLRFALSSGRWIASVEMNRLDNGQRHDHPFDWPAHGFFPFDTARSVYGIGGGDVAIGTDLGLAILSSGQPQLIDMALQPGDNHPRISAIGRPLSAPERLLARAGSLCAELKNGGWGRCDDPEVLEERFLGESELWRWTWEGATIARYLDHTRALIGPAIRGTPPPRFPHDRPRDLVRCGGDSFAVRADGLIERYGDANGHPRTSAGLWSLSGSGNPRLVCVRAAIILEGEDLPLGLYLLTGSSALRFELSSWTPVGEEHRQAVRRLADGDLLPDWGRLRARRSVESGGGWWIEYLDLSDRWHGVEWQNGRLILDEWTGPATIAHGKFWAATPAGFVSFELDPSGLRMDPRTVSVVPVAPDGAPPCEVKEIETRDGRTAHVPAAPDLTTRFRCADSRVFEGVLDGRRDIGVFSPPTGADPFADRTLVLWPQRLNDELLWTWRVIAQTPGLPGSLEITYRSEPVSLSAGRLDVDSLSQLANYESEMIEQLSPAGWHRVNPMMDLHSLSRWTSGEIDASAVVGLTVDRPEGSGDPVFCLSLGQGGGIEIDSNGRRRPVAACAQYLGTDGLWVYRLQEEMVRGSAKARNGAVAGRRLVGGRFSDLWALGLPVSWNRQGAIETYVPTRAGTSAFGSSGRPIAIYTRGSDTVAVALHENQVVHIGRNGSATLSGEVSPICPALVRRMARLPDGLRVISLEPRGKGGWDMLLHGTEQPLQGRFQCEAKDGGDGAIALWMQRGDVSERLRFEGNSSRWPDAGRVLFAWLDEGDLDLADGRGRRRRLAVGMESPPRRIAMAANRLFVLTQTDLFGGAVDSLLAYLHDTSYRPEIRSETKPEPPPPSPPAYGEAPMADTVDKASADQTAAERKVVQRALRDRGYYEGAIDGLLGPMTEAAVKAFQKAEDAPETGVLTPSQVERLIGSSDRVGED